MAYDSTTATALALRSYQQAVAGQDASRRNLLQNYGLNADGSLDGTNTLGSIYQTGLQGERGVEAARTSDMARGFGASGSGLGARGQVAARDQTLLGQASAEQQATQDLAGNQLQTDQLGDQYHDQLTQISSNKSQDDAQTLINNNIMAAQGLNPDGTAIPQSAPVPAVIQTLAQKQAAKVIKQKNTFGGYGSPAGGR